MKVRRVFVVGWVAGLVLALAVPAQAKGVSGVTLTGGGEEITFEGSGEPNTNTKLSNLAGSARLFQGLESDRPPTMAPSGDLALPITARWRFPTSATEATIVVQYLYLDAPDGPIGHCQEVGWLVSNRLMTSSSVAVARPVSILSPKRVISSWSPWSDARISRASPAASASGSISSCF